MALETYRKKRKFKITPEPRGRKGRRGGDSYVIQKHAARRLHYDLRLELDGVMKSWAVTRGPSLDPSQKRLAVHVEDHPIAYNTFEGTIPQGEYGGGTVMVWDRGHWIPDGDPQKGYAKGHLDFTLEGEKLHGHWHLVRMRGHGRRENWLLIKGKDGAARTGNDQDILIEKPLSAATGRSMEEIAENKKRVWHSNRAAKKAPQKKTSSTAASSHAKRAKTRVILAKQRNDARLASARLPDYVPPSLATLHSDAPRGKEWLHEIKFDGYRIEARLDRGKVRLFTRNRQDWTHRFKPIADAVAALPAKTALLDGELVVEDKNGVSNFSLLQADLKSGRQDRLVYYVFDLLHLDGRDLEGEPLIIRKAALSRLTKTAGRNGRVRYSEHFDEDGPLVFKHACDMKLEGIVSKRRDAPYRYGRSENFIKTKCRNAQEFVVAGFSPSTAQRAAIGALIAAIHDDGKLLYVGRIGTGYTRQTAHDLWQRLDKLRISKPPLALPKDERRKDVVWVKPKVVVEAEFRGFTGDNLLRQASFKGVREDKPARQVTREIPTALAMAAQRLAVRKSAKPAAVAKSKPKTSTVRNAKVPKGNAADPETANRKSTEVGHIRLTHPDRLYWADVGVTKENLAEYYVSVWPWMAPHIVDRPLALVRCPDGINGQCFFQKHISENVRDSPLRHKVDAKEHDVIAVEKIDDVISLAQSGTLEIHIRGSRLGQLERCDRLVFDLDPGEGVAWRQVIEAAKEIHERLAVMRLKSFAKTSGSKGIHVVVPIDGVDWGAAKTFTQHIVRAMATDNPQRYVAKITKSQRKGRIFIDYFRNSREATSVAPYSTRARPGAPVSAPLTWEALSRSKASTDFDVFNLKERLKRDPWAEVERLRQKLPAI